MKFPFVHSIVAWAMKKRYHQIELFVKYPIEVQKERLNQLVQQAKDTEWGRTYKLASIQNYREFADCIPVQDYMQLQPFIERMMRGEANVLWPGHVKWFAKSSGTTSAKSKFIPITQDSLEDCHFKTGRDMLSIYVNNFPETQLFSGKSLIMAGSSSVNPFNDQSYYGDLSAILVNNLPVWVDLLSTPDAKTALIENFEEKMVKVMDIVQRENVTSMTGVPSWTMVLLHRLLEKTGKSNLLEIWPNLELFMHGGVSFTPYREQFKAMIPSEQMHYMETYNASEGFFAIQDRPDANDMLLMLDYGIFFEFIPLEEIGKPFPNARTIGDVEVGVNYAILITTNGGLWRYQIGDTVRFTSTQPHRIVITGRTKFFINAFGEEVIQENAEQALAEACKKNDCSVAEYTAGPRFMAAGVKGAHEWVVEFDRAPINPENFANDLDEALQRINSDYEAKRSGNLALERLILHTAPEGFFYNWMKDRGKLGGQNKVPRLSNDRIYLDDLLNRL